MGIRFCVNLLAVSALVAVSACGNAGTRSEIAPASENGGFEEAGKSSIWDVLKTKNTESTTKVNKYIWQASLEVLDFLPIQTIDPFTGVIVMGYGTPPGGSKAYRATIYIKDPALDARSLNLAVSTKSGPVSAATLRTIEDSILTRARQLRKQDSRF